MGLCAQRPRWRIGVGPAGQCKSSRSPRTEDLASAMRPAVGTTALRPLRSWRWRSRDFHASLHGKSSWRCPSKLNDDPGARHTARCTANHGCRRGGARNRAMSNSRAQAAVSARSSVQSKRRHPEAQPNQSPPPSSPTQPRRWEKRRRESCWHHRHRQRSRPNRESTRPAAAKRPERV